MSSASIGSGLMYASASLTKSCHHTSRSCCQLISWPVRLYTMSVLTNGHSLSASSVFFLSAT